jgi:hypothetical protein
MSTNSNSRKHHWWPVALQKHWTDKAGDVWWILPDGSVDKKRAHNRKVAQKPHGHTMLRGSVFETNFENLFQDADDGISSVVESLIAIRPFGRTIKEVLLLTKLFLKPSRKLRDVCNFSKIDEQLHRKIILMIFSLLLRSPAKRFKYEGYSSLIGRPSSSEVGKGNMNQYFQIAQRLCKQGLLSGQFFVLIHSPYKTFICGDGNLDWLTDALVGNAIRGKALVPLTPHLCVYFCTPMVMREGNNCASFGAPSWMVDWINEIVQIYSQDIIFFRGKPPILSPSYKERKFLEHNTKSDALIEMLDDLVYPKDLRKKLYGGFLGQ